MLILENISFQANKKIFMNSSKKYLKVSISIIVIIQIIKFVKLNLKDQFAVRHQQNGKKQQPFLFSYKNNIIFKFMGKMIFGQNDTFNNFDVFNQKQQKAGILSVNIRKKLKYAPDASIQQSELQILVIRSIVAHISQQKYKRAYINFILFDKSYKTPIAKIKKSGQLLFDQKLQIEKTDQIGQAKVQLYFYDAKQQKSYLAGSGMISFQNNQQKKVKFINQKGKTQGDAFIDFKVSSKQKYQFLKKIAEIKHNRPSGNMSTIDNYVVQNKSTFRNLSMSQNLQQNTEIKNRKNRMSVVNRNLNIFMPTQKRFMIYEDRPNRIVSYLEQRDPFDLKQKHSKMYYKGASIGVGKKSDFAHQKKDNPGVGVYKLPSIWDRY